MNHTPNPANTTNTPPLPPAVAQAAQANPLTQLKDIHLPQPPTAWPIAPGWWILFACVLAIVMTAGLRIRRRYRHNRHKRVALSTLRYLERVYLKGKTPNELSQQFSHELLHQSALLLRQVSLICYARHEVAPLAGDEWLTFLNRTGNTNEFTHGVGRYLAEYRFRPETTGHTPVELDAKELISLIRHWLKQQPDRPYQQ